MTEYERIARTKYARLRDRDFLTLAIETSCDETAASVLRGRKILSNAISSQIEIHRRFGGVVPEIASRNHAIAINGTVSESLERAGASLRDIDLVAVTYGAGLQGALLVGVAFAKALAYALGIPLLGISHLKGHIMANMAVHDSLDFPFLCLLASGGHTQIVAAKSYADMTVLGETRDDAVGEAFDKTARVLGLPYPGGPSIERLASAGRNSIPLPRPYKNEDTLDFSYSGIKTSVINYIRARQSRGEPVAACDVARSFQERAIGMLIENALRAAEKYGCGTLVAAGGVCANSFLRERLVSLGEKMGLKVYLPPKILCTDNAAMIGAAAYYAVREGVDLSPLSLDARPFL